MNRAPVQWSVRLAATISIRPGSASDKHRNSRAIIRDAASESRDFGFFNLLRMLLGDARCIRRERCY